MTDTSSTDSRVSGHISLAAAKQGHSYIIVSSSATGRNRMRMDSLGLIPGDAVHVLFKNFSGLVIAIKGSRLALSRAIADSLMVREFEDSDWANDVTS